MLAHLENLPDPLRHASYVVMTAVVALALLAVMGFAGIFAATIASDRSANDATYHFCVGNSQIQSARVSDGLFDTMLIHC